MCTYALIWDGFMTASLTTASFVISEIKKLDYGINYTEKFETSIETQISQAIETSLRRVSSHVCLASLLAILI